MCRKENSHGNRGRLVVSHIRDESNGHHAVRLGAVDRLYLGFQIYEAAIRQRWKNRGVIHHARTGLNELRPYE
jgi:hypothetical protein